MPVDVQKLLNWIDNSDNLNDFEAIQITIMGGEHPVAKFPQQQMAVFSKEESRRKVLSSAMSGLIKQIGRFETTYGESKPPVEELPRIIVADIDNINRIVDVAEWSDTEDWNFKHRNYWIVAKRLASPLLGPSEKRFPWLALIPRNGTKNSPAVRFLQPVDLSAMDMKYAKGRWSKQDVEVLEGLEAYLAEIGNTDVYHVAKIYFGPLKSQ